MHFKGMASKCCFVQVGEIVNAKTRNVFILQVVQAKKCCTR